MKAEEFVKSRYPKAKCERHKSNSPFGGSYYLIRDGRSFMYMSEGRTASKAWTNAKKQIETNDKDAIKPPQ